MLLLDATGPVHHCEHGQGDGNYDPQHVFEELSARWDVWDACAVDVRALVFVGTHGTLLRRLADEAWKVRVTGDSSRSPGPWRFLGAQPRNSPTNDEYARNRWHPRSQRRVSTEVRARTQQHGLVAVICEQNAFRKRRSGYLGGLDALRKSRGFAGCDDTRNERLRAGYRCSL
jgi:hypothetical protein